MAVYLNIPYVEDTRAISDWYSSSEWLEMNEDKMRSVIDTRNKVLEWRIERDIRDQRFYPNN